jgi:phage replication-related protein YjqB (UPF0714/DUF867 family)
MTDLYRNFSDLAAHKKEGRDFNVVTHEVEGSRISIVAPHAGTIEWNTGRMAKEIAANDHTLYMFEGTYDGGGFSQMHLTSTHFDEPRALALVAKTETTITIHGCHYQESVVYLSGTDEALEKKLCEAFNKAGIKASIEGHPYQSGKLLDNICNKNHSGKGVQIEFSRGIRDNDALRDTCVKIVRDALKA